MTAGWFKLSNARLFHWFARGRSLCGKWLYLGSGELDPDTAVKLEECQGCRRKVDENIKENSNAKEG